MVKKIYFVEKILDNKVTGTKVDSFEGDLMILKEINLSIK